MHTETKFFFIFFLFFSTLKPFVNAIKEHEKIAITAVGFLIKYQLQQIGSCSDKEWLNTSHL